MFAALLLAAALTSPSPAPMPFPEQTPPPEPNHITLAAEGSYVTASGDNWQNWNGFSAQALGQYEFNAGPHLRFSNTLHWERLSSNYAVSFAGTTFHAPFNFDEYDDEFDVELGKPQLPTGLGIGYYDYSPVYLFYPGTYHMSGLGFGVDRWANWYVPSSFYVSAWYFPSLTSTGASGIAYGILRADLGFNVRQSLVSPWGFRVGVQDEAWFGQNVRSPNYNFIDPYVSVTWWQ